MPTWKAPPPILQPVPILLLTHLDADELALGRARRGPAARQQIRAWPANRVLDHVRQEGRQHEGRQQAEEGDVRFVEGGAQEQGPEREREDWDAQRVGEEPACVRAERVLVDGGFRRSLERCG